MGRAERALDPAEGPVALFAYELRKVRKESGLTYRAMAAKAHYSTATLAHAAAGERLPSLPVTLAYVQACGGDAEAWTERWNAAQHEMADQPISDDETSAPYLGLARFTTADREKFFGRDRLVEQLAALVRSRSVTVLVGPSGSGKSSLLRAGLIPHLQDRLPPAHRPTAIRILTPGPRPASTHGTLLDPSRSEAGTLVIVDQFEESFTLCEDLAERTRFIDLLLGASPSPRVLIAVRADFYGHLAQHRALAEALAGGTLLVPPMDPAELRQAIVKPAATAGLVVERALTARIIKETDGESGGLPLMSHALLETWRRRRGRTLKEADYEAAGGIHGAILRTAEDLYHQLTPEQRTEARRILLRLVTPGQGTQDTRRPTDRTEFTTGHPDAVATVLERLARARLITLDETTADLAHEALITAWPRLRAWIGADRERMRQHRLLTDAATSWHALGRDPGALYRGARLTAAEGHFARRPGEEDELNYLEREFLTAGLAARTRDRRLRRTRTGALCVLLVLVLVASLTVWQQNRAEERRRIEAEARRIAGIAESMRQSDPVTAMRLGLASWRIARLPETRAALMSAMAQPEQASFDVPYPGPDMMFRLSADGRTLLSIDRAEVTEWDVAHRTRKRTLPGLMEAFPDAVSPRADSRWLPMFTGKGMKQRVRVRDLTSGRLSTWQAPAAAGAEVGSSGRSLVTYEKRRVRDATEQTVVVRTMDSGKVLLALPPRQRPAPRPGTAIPDASDQATELRRTRERRGVGVVQDVTISGDDRLLALCIPDEPVQLWDLVRRRKVTAPWTPTTSRQQCLDETVQFTPDNRMLVVVGPEGVRSWDLATGRVRTTIEHSGIREVRYSDDGSFLAMADRTELLIWRTRNARTPVFRYPLRGEAATDLRFDRAAGQLRYLSNSNAAWGTTVHSLDLNRILAADWRPEPSTGSAFSPDGTMLVTVHQEGQRIRFRLRDLRPGGGWRALPSMSCRSVIPSSPVPCASLLAFSPDSRTLAFGTDEADAPRPARKVHFWDIRRHRVTRTDNLLAAELQQATVMAYAPDGRSLLLMEPPGQDSSAVLWDLRDRRVTMAWAGNSQALLKAPDGMWLVTSDGQVHKARKIPWMGSTAVSSRFTAGLPLAATTDGAYQAVGDLSGRIGLWGTRWSNGEHDGELIGSGPGASDPILALAFSPDSRRLAASSADGALRIWDIASRRPIGSPLLTSGDPVTDLRFSPSGNELYTSGRNIPFQAYSIGPDAVAATVCRRADGPLSRRDWKQLIPTVAFQDICR
ncbi:helix-turn-helix domain-containing protein [Streptomyces sp. NPDC004728]|uniref:nSTAND1 domain-containing NTPase n=1 Tax=Streptomyces sp. NPDC004728 TaxID=3154289 RepID=UPI0033B749D0